LSICCVRSLCAALSFRKYRGTQHHLNDKTCSCKLRENIPRGWFDLRALCRAAGHTADKHEFRLLCVNAKRSNQQWWKKRILSEKCVNRWRERWKMLWTIFCSMSLPKVLRMHRVARGGLCVLSLPRLLTRHQPLCALLEGEGAQVAARRQRSCCEPRHELGFRELRSIDVVSTACLVAL
jgi:hypothetical protein